MSWTQHTGQRLMLPTHLLGHLNHLLKFIDEGSRVLTFRPYLRNLRGPEILTDAFKIRKLVKSQVKNGIQVSLTHILKVAY